MRIIHLPSSYLPQTVGGTEQYVHRLCEGLGRKGHEVLVAYHGQGEPAEQLSSNYRVTSLGALRQPSRKELYSVSMRETPPGFSQLMRTFSPDLIHFHSFTLGAGIDHARAANELGIPYVVTYHVPSVTCPRGTLVRFGREVCDGLMDEKKCAPCLLENQGVPLPVASVLGRSEVSADKLPDGWWTVKFASRDLVRRHHETSREFLAKAAHIIACSEWSFDVLVLNGVDREKISVRRQAMPGATRVRQLRLPIDRDRPIRLGFLGSSVPDKGPDLLLRSIPYLRRQGLQIQCELSGPMNPRHEAWAHSLLREYSTEARYLGFTPDHTLNQWLSSLDLLVVPSRWMELGTYTLLEAWDNGTPVIGANLGGIPEFLDSNGLSDLLFDLNDPKSIAETVLRATEWKEPFPPVVVPGVEDLCEFMIDIYSDISRKVLAGITTVNL